MSYSKILSIIIIMSLFGCNNNSEKNSQNTSTAIPTIELSTNDLESPIKEPTIKSKVNEKWHLIWQDEFDNKNIDLTKWSFEVNCFGGGNNEQQCYTDREKNAYVEQGVLNIVAVKENFTGPAANDDEAHYDPNYTRTLPYTSARLRSKNKGDWTFGRFEISAKLPKGQGTWPAIWMLPTDWIYGTWAASGEIDIMEAVNLTAQSDEKGAFSGQAESRIHGTLHYGRASPENTYIGTSFHLPNGENPADGFHEYAIEWQEGEIRWYVDDIHYATQRDTSWYNQYLNDDGVFIQGTGSAPFDQKFHLLLNFAVGGNWPANVNEKGIDESVFPQSLEIDYVRVYECPVNAFTGAGCETIGDEAILVEGKAAPNL